MFAYSVAAIFVAIGIEAAGSRGVDLERVGVIATAVIFTVFIPFLVAKFALHMLGAENLFGHAIGGSVVGGLTYMVFFQESVTQSLLFGYSLLGGSAGVVYYWVRRLCHRWVGQRHTGS